MCVHDQFHYRFNKTFLNPTLLEKKNLSTSLVTFVNKTLGQIYQDKKVLLHSNGTVHRKLHIFTKCSSILTGKRTNQEAHPITLKYKKIQKSRHSNIPT